MLLEPRCHLNTLVSPLQSMSSRKWGAGIQDYQEPLDSPLRGNDAWRGFRPELCKGLRGETPVGADLSAISVHDVCIFIATEVAPT
jgi:hypothetical protein